MQLVELQEAWPKLQANGVALFAISYDSLEVLAAFAERHGITYPLLSDEGSHSTHALGSLNEQHLVEQHAFYGIQTRDEQRGVAYPGTFVLDERGIITEKHFEQSYRVRPTARIVKVAGLDEFFVVYEDSMRTMVPRRFTKNPGAIVITPRIEYQACTRTVCFPLAALHVDVHLNGLDLIRD